MHGERVKKYIDQFTLNGPCIVSEQNVSEDVGFNNHYQ